MKRVLVTGGLGFIGTSLVPKLHGRFGAEIRILDNMSNPSGDLVIADGIEVVEAKENVAAFIEELFGKAGVLLPAHTRASARLSLRAR